MPRLGRGQHIASKAHRIRQSISWENQLLDQLVRVLLARIDPLNCEHANILPAFRCGSLLWRWGWPLLRFIKQLGQKTDKGNTFECPLGLVLFERVSPRIS